MTTNCLAVVAGNFEPVEDKPLKELVTGLLDKKGTGYSLTASITRDISRKGLLYGWVMNGGRYH
jgi:hypothetical protein